MKESRWLPAYTGCLVGGMVYLGSTGSAVAIGLFAATMHVVWFGFLRTVV